LSPEAIFIPPDFLRYRAVSRSVREIFTQHTELIEPCLWTRHIWT
jgi:DNA polymerase IV